MITEAFELVTVGPAHARVLSMLHQGAFGRDAGWNEGAFERLLGTPGTFGWVAQVAGAEGPQPVALVVARAVADEAEILTIGTLPSVRRKGLARGLVRAAAAEAATRGAGRLFLEVAVDNPAGVALYHALGFEEVGRRKRYYARSDGTRVDAIVMARAVA
ncbi:Ribosomal-protein-S18p-alanine acetyltransferase [Caenispirillum salinarum AK4]|uniref:Ribosomal-protein-S18p-alanine acetyltransferase n=1 Tax=Caenispirillum salinarum AK4 TaxID=1238182 RepID=K9GP25_9PROT|nr:N-acetyltransferase [Caenispirillum salinarum]EKV27675.1 Ribosomal-protein-S18p-alanine acetyltransferase [Caenispirillum salinarum AK4]